VSPGVSVAARSAGWGESDQTTGHPPPLIGQEPSLPARKRPGRVLLPAAWCFLSHCQAV
jgi:hypothetical protein